MKKTGNRLFAIVLSLVMVLSAVPFSAFTFSVGALSQPTDVINSIKTQYPNGSYFSVNGKACPHGSIFKVKSDGTTCYNCELHSILKNKGLSTKGYANGRTCYAFASYVFTKCFGKTMSSDNYTSKSRGFSKSVSAATKYDFLKQAKIGDILYTGGHYMVFISCDKNGVTVYDNNVGGAYYCSKGHYRCADHNADYTKGGYTGKVRYGTIKYGNFNYSSLSIWHAKNYPNPDPVKVEEPKMTTSNAAEGVNISLSCSTSGATIYYTTNGSTPSDSSGTKYTTAIHVTENTTVKAIAVKSGMGDSSVLSKSISVGKVEKPVITGKSTPDGVNVTLSSVSGSSVYYTVDGTEPSSASTLYSSLERILLTENTEIKAIAYKNGMAKSDIASESFALTKPDAPVVRLDSASQVCVDSLVSAAWNAMDTAYEYIVVLSKDNEVIDEQVKQGTTASFKVADVGTYVISVKAVNVVGVSVPSSVSITVMPDVTVQFLNYDGSEISAQTVHWGESAIEPMPPSREGYTFRRWNGNYQNVKKDTTVTAVFTPNTYTLTFLDENGNTIDAVTAEYDSTVIPPQAPAKTGYTFECWSVKSGRSEPSSDGSSTAMIVKGAAVFVPVYVWSNPDMPLGLSIESALRSTDAESYNVCAKVTNNTDKIVNGKLIAVIKTANDKVVATEISAVTVAANASEEEYNVTIGSKEDAMRCEVYVVANDPDNANRTGGAYSEPATAVVTKESSTSYSYWTDWSAWSTNNVQASDTKEVRTKTQYRYKDKITTTSTSSSLDGWTPSGSSVTYGSWGSWSEWSTTEQTASSTKDVETRSVYYYFHYCDGKNNFAPSTNYSYGVYGPHTVYSTGKIGGKEYSSNASGYKYVYSEANGCEKGCHSWYVGGTKTQYRYRTRTSTTNYSYWKWDEYSEWSDDVCTASSTRMVESRIVYAYRDLIQGTDTVTEELIVPENTSGTSYTVSGQLDTVLTDYSGKKATVMVYKNRNVDPTEDQIEYVGQITLGENNAYSVSFVPREEISQQTGDYIVSFGIATATGLINNVECIRAPKPVYKVDFINVDGSILSSQNVIQGDDAVAPDLPTMEGYTLSWNRTSTNINGDTTIRVEATPKQYPVVFVDWANNRILDIQEISYGNSAVLPDDVHAEGKVFEGWSISEDSVITEPTVAEAVYTDVMYTVNFLNKDGSVFYADQIAHGNPIVLPEEEPQAEGYLFLGWYTEDPWLNVTSDVTVYPIFIYLVTAGIPFIDIWAEEEPIFYNYAAITLESSTEDASIYYTLDGSEPTTDSLLFEDVISLDESVTIKAIAVNDNMNASPVFEYDVVVEAAVDDPPEGMESKLTVASCTTSAGKTIEVPVMLEDNPGLIATKITLSYDTDVLQLVGVTDGGLLGTNTMAAGNNLTAVPYTVLWEDSLATENHDGDGVLVTFTFTILENAQPGTTTISITYDEGSTLDVDLNHMILETINGTIEVLDRVAGDVNADGIVNLMDVVILRRYLAGGWDVTIHELNADVNRNNSVNLEDVVLLRRYLAGGWKIELA